MENWHSNGCVVYIVPRDAIMLGIRLEFSVAEFFASGGIVSFTDRMAAVLNIHAADIKVVAVYEGSTIVEFQVIQRDPEVVEESDLISLSQIDKKYRQFINSKETFMGSRILDAKVGGAAIISPFEQARRKEGLFEEDEFNQFVDEQMGGSKNVFGDKTQETKKKEKNKDLVEIKDP